MRKLIIPAILAATVLVAGIFAFMPAQEASTVHTTILQQTTASGFDTIVLNNAVIFDADAERFVLFDLHESVVEGFVVIRADNTVTCTNLRVVSLAVDGTIEASTDMAELVGAAEAGGDYEQLCHGHIAADADTILIGLARTAGNAETLPVGTVITTTITEVA